MKTLSEIESRIRGLLAEEFDRRVEEAHLRLPSRCVHNHRQELDPRKRVEDEPNPSYNRVDRYHLPVVNKTGLCMLGADSPEDWQGTICEDPIDAQRCPSFTAIETKSEIYTNFMRDLTLEGWIAKYMPETAALLWVLEAERLYLRVPWWKRLWFRLLRVRLEPLAPDYEIVKALGQGLQESDDGVHGS